MDVEWENPFGWIAGFMFPDELEWLASHAYQRHVLEVGCWLGCSTVAMAQTALQVTVVDNFSYTTQLDRSKLRDRPGIGWQRTVFQSHLDEWGLQGRVEILEGDSLDLLPRLVATPGFGLAVVDGNHDYDHAVSDIYHAMRLLRPGGWLAVDDVDWPGVTKALCELGVGLTHAAGKVGWWQKPEDADAGT